MKAVIIKTIFLAIVVTCLLPFSAIATKGTSNSEKTSGGSVYAPKAINKTVKKIFSEYEWDVNDRRATVFAHVGFLNMAENEDTIVSVVKRTGYDGEINFQNVIYYRLQYLSKTRKTDTVKINETQGYNYYLIAVAEKGKIVGAFIGVQPYNYGKYSPEMNKLSRIYPMSIDKEQVDQEMRDILVESANDVGPAQTQTVGIAIP